MLLLERIVDWVLFTLSTTCFIKAHLGETLNSTTRTLFSSNLSVTWCKSVRLVHIGPRIRASWLIRDATTLHYGHLLIDLSLRTEHALRNCTNSGSIPSSSCISDGLKQSLLLDDEKTKSIHFPIIPINFPKMQKPFPSSFPVSLWLFSKSSQKKPAEYKKTTRDETSKGNSIALCRKNLLEAKMGRSGEWKKIDNS